MNSEQAGRIDLLITDIVMPEMGGGALADLVTELCPRIRTLYMSGYTEDEVVRRGVISAGDRFLEKPFAPGELARKVRDVLDGR